jgi:O-acetyl-ADP-ribose deacetylase (regulator of RNase III)
MYTEYEGDLIVDALSGKFDAIAHGCNCFCTMGAGIALPMREKFYADTARLEQKMFRGDINKLGCIDFINVVVDPTEGIARVGMAAELWSDEWTHGKIVSVINAYTQYQLGKDARYDALSTCLSKINHVFRNKKVGIPRIGCQIGGLDWTVVKPLIERKLTDVDVTVVIK